MSTQLLLVFFLSASVAVQLEKEPPATLKPESLKSPTESKPGASADSPLDGAPTKSEGTDKPVVPSPVPADVVTKEVAPEFSFPVWDTEGKICILAKLTATFTITYPSLGGEQSVSVNLPEDATTKGRCGSLKQDPVLELSWPLFRLSMIFTKIKYDLKNPEGWAVISMELLYNTAGPLFDGATNVGKKTARSEENNTLFETPMGKSYFCPSPEVVPMFDSKKDRVAIARFKDVHIQAYGIQFGKFSPVQRCSLVRIGGLPEPFAQDETVPIAVGSTLAVLAVLVVLGYALYRNMAARRVDYSTME